MRRRFVIHSKSFISTPALDVLQEILGFICASVLLREANKAEYKFAREENPGQACTNTWLMYIRKSTRTPARKLRGEAREKPLLEEKYHENLAHAQCHSYPVCSRHTSDDPLTVQVISQFRAGSTKSIVEMLEAEQPKFLLSTEEMDLINIFMVAKDAQPFPYLELVKYDSKFAVPQLRNSDDKKECAKEFCT